MEKRELGKTGIAVSPLMFGGNVFGWTIDEATSFKLLDAFTDAGLNFVDTADVYSRWVQGNKGGESETIIGNWFKRSGKRDKIVLATKVGKDMGDGKKGLAAGYIKQAIEDSLKRLQTDYIDLYQSHDDDLNTPFEETLEAYSQLIKEGKVRVIGASNYKTNRLAQALQVSAEKNLASYQTLQPEYNLYARQDYETNLEPLCLERGLGVVPFYSLASGFLTGKYRSEADFNKSKRGGGMTKYLNDRGLRILDSLDKIADQYQTSQASVALAWLMSRPSITAPIVSATSIGQLKDLIDATELNLSEEGVRVLDEASAY
ncbi:aldo/keto reductase [Mucilaginibacter mali]|uniref:Aldo/keto reductase n=1 Tax=Mucilaginibacter mali TaxID=2740462 RepID=A0A7D4QJX5_9SPHI|nr:aldo/keto reductase [Mucilaginibacter mali]QKJ29990.1 aldo/keto reductase [Mucilaginibacter mali]